jgi:hypothetical protein
VLTVVVGAERAGGGVGAGPGAGAGVGATAIAPSRHCSMYRFSVIPFASLSALFTLHSARHSFALFPLPDGADGGGTTFVCTGAAAGAAVSAVPRHCAT